jgi:hypothetical protein
MGTVCAISAQPISTLTLTISCGYNGWWAAHDGQSAQEVMGND